MAMRRSQTTTVLWKRVLLEMSNNTRDLVLRSRKRVDSGQMTEEQAGSWMAQRVKDLAMFTDDTLTQLWIKCT